MYLVDSFTKEQMEEGGSFRQQADLFKVPLHYIEAADRCEVWGTSFGDPDEYCEYRFFKNNIPCGVFTVPGY